MPSAQCRASRRKKQTQLCLAACAALRAWIRADLAAAGREAKLTEARRLTGIAVDLGALRPGAAVEV